MQSTLISTLGTQPQIIPLSAQLLEQSNESVSKIVVLHTNPFVSPIREALDGLQSAFDRHTAWPELVTELIPANDIVRPDELDLFADLLFSVIKREIQAERRIHLLLAGGRKPMAMIGTTVAQMLLSEEDRLWYLFSVESLRLSRRFSLLPGEHAELIPVLLPRMSAVPPVYRRSFLAEAPREAFHAMEREQKRQLCHFVEQELTAAERELAMLLVEDVLTVAELATKLNKKPKRVTNQLNSIYSKAESTFGLRPDRGVKREFLRRQLLPYFEDQ